jgi:hypothetical protein
MTTTATAGKYARRDVTAAFQCALAEVEDLAGEDMALDAIRGLRLGAFLPDGRAAVTRETAVGAFNALADAAKERYNPDGGDYDATARADTCGDLMVELAAGFLANPGADPDDIIAGVWSKLDLDDFPTYAAWRQLNSGTLADYERERRSAIVAEVKGWL